MEHMMTKKQLNSCWPIDTYIKIWTERKNTRSRPSSRMVSSLTYYFESKYGIPLASFMIPGPSTPPLLLLLHTSPDPWAVRSIYLLSSRGLAFTSWPWCVYIPIYQLHTRLFPFAPSSSIFSLMGSVTICCHSHVLPQITLLDSPTRGTEELVLGALQFHRGNSYWKAAVYFQVQALFLLPIPL